MTQSSDHHRESDRPIKRRSAAALREKSIRHDHLAAVKALLEEAARELRTVLQDEPIITETPLEAQCAIESATQSIEWALVRLASVAPKDPPSKPPPGAPTRRQGQFLAYIREFMLQAGVAPSHAELQFFFNLTAPSVNSMLIRLEQRGFIRRVPGKARAIEIISPPDWIPPLDRPLRF